MEWISVKDRLPDMFEDVLVYEIVLGFYVARLGQFYFETDIGILQEVTHWMPLPETPTPTPDPPQ